MGDEGEIASAVQHDEAFKSEDGSQYPFSTAVALFADSVPSLTFNAGIVRFYCSRIDVSVNGLGSSANNTVAQIIMPVEGFASAVTFFEAQLEAMVRRGLIDREKIERFRRENMAAMDAKYSK